jgi:hypothetical protein
LQILPVSPCSVSWTNSNARGLWCDVENQVAMPARAIEG